MGRKGKKGGKILVLVHFFRRALRPLSLLQAARRAIHFKHVVNFDEGQRRFLPVRTPIT